MARWRSDASYQQTSHYMQENHRKEVERLRKEIDRVEAERDQWRKRCREMREQRDAVTEELAALNRDLFEKTAKKEYSRGRDANS